MVPWQHFQFGAKKYANHDELLNERSSAAELAATTVLGLFTSLIKKGDAEATEEEEIAVQALKRRRFEPGKAIQKRAGVKQRRRCWI